MRHESEYYINEGGGKSKDGAFIAFYYTDPNFL